MRFGKASNGKCVDTIEKYVGERMRCGPCGMGDGNESFFNVGGLQKCKEDRLHKLST